MLSIKLIPLLYFIVVANSKGVQKSSSLTESLGQEVIEIGNPIKELPPGMEEEPSAENDEDTKVTATTLPAATKRVDLKKLTTEGRRKIKDVDKIDGVTVDEESRIEKELAEIYKDTNSNDYSAEMVPEKLKANYKPIERSGFKFQPDNINNKAEVERFRTSIDEISCDRSNTEKLAFSTPESTTPGSASRFLLNTGLIISLVCALIMS